MMIETECHPLGTMAEVAGLGSIYMLLARLYKDVAPAKLLQSLKDPRMLGILEEFGCTFDKDFIDLEIDEVFVERMAVDFTQLFIGPSEFISPYESMFHERVDDDWGKLWGADTVRVKKFIESAGLEFSKDYGGIPDHLAVELEFMAAVTGKIEEALVAEKRQEALYFLRMKKLFFDDHLSQWIPAFCRKAIPKAETSFYREISRFLALFLEMEHKALDEDILALESQGAVS
jgi:TorA maturation chaperone TorD